MESDSQETLRLLQNNVEAETVYLRQLHVWLGTSSAGGALAIASLSANLPDPSFALGFFIECFWLFLFGVMFAGTAVFTKARQFSDLNDHFASAHNRIQLNLKISQMAVTVSSPARLAEEMNRPRNDLIKQSKLHHEFAEAAWRRHLRWRRLWAASLGMSALCFFFGFAWPLAKVSFCGLNVEPVMGHPGVLTN